jgi:hypothetical protein
MNAWELRLAVMKESAVVKHILTKALIVYYARFIGRCAGEECRRATAGAHAPCFRCVKGDIEAEDSRKGCKGRWDQLATELT